MMRSGPTLACALAAVLALALSACGSSDGGPGPETGDGAGGGSGGGPYDRSHVVGLFDAGAKIAQTATYGPDDQAGGLVEHVVELDKSVLRGELPDDYELIEGGSFHGVPIGMTSSGASDSGGDAQVTKLGGWLEHGYFEARMFGSFALEDRGFVDTGALTYAIGTVTGTNPTGGSATWTGASVGFDVGVYAAYPIVGEAILTVDFSPYRHFPDTAAVDIEINDLRRVDGTQAAYDDIEFAGVPVVDGEFYDGPVTEVPAPDDMGNAHTEIFLRHHVSGAFFGPNHEEVGGVYVVTPTEDYRDQVIVGAFGATRDN